MKRMVGVLAILSGLGALVAGCDSSSYENTINCTSTNSLSGTGRALIVQGVTYIDPGTAGTAIPLANGTVRLISDQPQIATVCDGDCTDGTGTFKKDLNVTTDSQGILRYTVQLTGTVVEGQIHEVVGAIDVQNCQVEFGP